MDPLYQSLLILLGLSLVFLNGFFVAAEFSIVKVRDTRLQELVLQGSRRAQSARTLVAKMDEYLSATQLGITLASLGLGWVGEPAFASLFEPLFRGLGPSKSVMIHSLSALLAFLLITFLHIVLGELAPKSLAIQKAEPVVMWTARPLIGFYRLSYPFIWMLNGAANFFLRLVSTQPVAGLERAHSEEELRLIISRSRQQGILDRDQGRMLERVLDFADRSVRQVMVPSPEVVFLDIRKNLEENLALAREHEHTRYPLCDGSLDRVLGLIHVKELFWKHQQLGDRLDLQSLKRRIPFVPESKFVKALLAEFRQNRSHMGIVVDEYGTNIGMVTMEDILEELVGEIEDEFDVEMPSRIRKMDDGRYMVQGRTLLEEVEKALGIEIDDEENDTIGGHVMMQLGRPAEIGDQVTLPGGYRVHVVATEGRQIMDLMFEKIGPPAS